MPPEYEWTWMISEKSDIYAFGVIVLETITWKRISKTSLLERKEKVFSIIYVKLLFSIVLKSWFMDQMFLICLCLSNFKIYPVPVLKPKYRDVYILVCSTLNNKLWIDPTLHNSCQCLLQQWIFWDQNNQFSHCRSKRMIQSLKCEW